MQWATASTDRLSPWEVRPPLTGDNNNNNNASSTSHAKSSSTTATTAATTKTTNVDDDDDDDDKPLKRLAQQSASTNNTYVNRSSICTTIYIIDMSGCRNSGVVANIDELTRALGPMPPRQVLTSHTCYSFDIESLSSCLVIESVALGRR